MTHRITETKRCLCLSRYKNRKLIVVAPLLILMLIPTEEALAWTKGRMVGSIEMGGDIASPQNENRWQIMVSESTQGLDMTLPEEGNIARHRLTQTLPLLGIRTIAGLSETFSGDDAGAISPQITFSGLLPGSRDKGRLPVELNVTRASDSSHYLGRLRLNLLAGAEVSQKHTVTGEGRRYSVYASTPGEAFYGGIARTPNEAVDNAISQIGDVFPVYRSRYNSQDIPAAPGAKQSVEFRNPQMQYSGFYGAGLVRGDVIVMFVDPDAGISGAETWKASMKIMVAYQ